MNIVVFGSNFNPIGNHHIRIIEHLVKVADLVKVPICGSKRDKEGNEADEARRRAWDRHRRNMAELALRDMQRVELDCYDLDNDVFTRTWDLQRRYRAQYPIAEIVFAVGGDLVEGGSRGVSQIQQEWKRGKEVWDGFDFIVLSHPNCPVDPRDCPPHGTILTVDGFTGRSSLIRRLVREGESVSQFLPKPVEEYIHTHGVYS